MTLSTIPRYDGDRITRGEGHAVVLGASMAGLLAARVLADRYATVTVLDRETHPETPMPRRGVPQGAHPHALLEAGRSTIEDLLPGFSDELVTAGGLVIDMSTDFGFYTEGDVLSPPTSQPMCSASRPLYEAVVARLVAATEGVSLRAPCQFLAYVTDTAAARVTGVRVRDEAGDAVELTADLVVDATGRSSKTPAWLAAHGFDAPRVEEVTVDVGYSSVILERPPEDRRAIIVSPSHPRLRAGGLLPVESDRWILNLAGMHGDHPPAELAELRAFAEQLPVPAFADLLDTQRVLSEEVAHYRYATSRRNRYDRLRQFPEGLVVIGDAIASFNPLYGQGMSVAAMEALELHHTLAEVDDDIGRQFFRRSAPLVETAWTLGVGADFAFPQTTGPKPRGTDLVSRYLSQLTRRAHDDPVLSEVFFDVLGLNSHPKSIFRPGVVWRVLGPRARPRPAMESATSTGPAE